MAHLGVHASSCHNCFTMAVGHAASGVDHVQPVSQRRTGGHHSLSVLLNWNGFTSKSRLLHLQIESRDQAPICGNVIARFDQNDIPGHQFAGINDGFLSITTHSRMGSRHILKCFQ